MIPALEFPQILYDHPNCKNLNVNASILSFYTRTIIPRITRRASSALASRNRAKGIVGDAEFEDDGNYGSAATIDVELLHAVSKRIHYGTLLQNGVSSFDVDVLSILKANSSLNLSSYPIHLHLSHIS